MPEKSTIIPSGTALKHKDGRGNESIAEKMRHANKTPQAKKGLIKKVKVGGF
jgi:hypothetical protein